MAQMFATSRECCSSHDFLDAGRMDAAVDHELVQGQAGDLAADRVEGGQHDGVRGVVHDDFHAGGGL